MKILWNSVMSIKSWLHQLVSHEIPDLSESYKDASIPEKQRQLVEPQLDKMYAGEAPQHFSVMGTVFKEIETLDETRTFSLLDAGCASGYYFEILRHFISRDFRYTGADFNAAMLRLARDKYPDVSLARMDLRAIAFPDGAFDVVLSGAVIVHIREWQKAVAELARVARHWLILHRCLVLFQGQTRIKIEKHYDVDVYRVYIHENELADLMQRSGFQLVRRLECFEGAHPEGMGNFTYLYARRG